MLTVCDYRNKFNPVHLVAMLMLKGSWYTEGKTTLLDEQGLFSDWELSVEINIEELGFSK